MQLGKADRIRGRE